MEHKYRTRIQGEALQKKIRDTEWSFVDILYYPLSFGLLTIFAWLTTIGVLVFNWISAILFSLITVILSIRAYKKLAYLSNLCRTVKNTSASLFVYKPWIDRFQELDISSERNNVSEMAIPIFIKALQELHGSASMRELKDAYCKATGDEIKDVTARTIMDGHGELFIKERIDGSNVRYILRADSSPQFENDSSPEFHKKIREKIISILKNTEGHCLRMSLVIRDVKNLIPKEKHSNIVYTIIRNMDNVEMYEVEGKKYLRLKTIV